MASPHYIFASWKNIVTSLKKTAEESARKIPQIGDMQYYEIHLPVGSCDSRRRTAVKDGKKPYHSADMKKGKRQTYGQG